MKPGYLLLCLLISAVMLATLAAASNWLLFALSKQNDIKWYYDKDSISYLRPKTIAGVELPRKDRNFPRLWIKSSDDKGGISYLVELNCKGRTARLSDESGKQLYEEPSIDYFYDRPVAPDSVLDSLRRAVCR